MAQRTPWLQQKKTKEVQIARKLKDVTRSLNRKRQRKQYLKPHLETSALQDILLAQPVVLIGLIAHLTGYALQEDIESSIASMLKLGKDILYSSSSNQGGSYDPKTTHMPGESPLGSKTIQLG